MYQHNPSEIDFKQNHNMIEPIYTQIMPFEQYSSTNMAFQEYNTKVKFYFKSQNVTNFDFVHN